MSIDNLGAAIPPASVSEQSVTATSANVPPAFAAKLERQAREFSARSKSGDGDERRPKRFMICDLEFIYDTERRAAYVDSEGDDAERRVRWCFHRVTAAAWTMLRFDNGVDVPVVEEVRIIGRDEADEKMIVSEVFDALRRSPDAIFTGWGSESKDLAVLRRCAGEFDLRLPGQLRNLHPHACERLDLCSACSVQAPSVHLPEYAHATGIPSKPWPSKLIGALVLRGDWKSVKEQALADVLTTSVIAIRHLNSHGIISCDAQRSTTLIAEAAAKAMPSSRFVRNSFGPWARGQLAASRLRGPVFRAA